MTHDDTTHIKRADVLTHLKAMPGGAAVDELAPLMGADTRSRWTRITQSCAELVGRGFVVWVHDPKPPNAYNRRRYYAIEHAPAVHGAATIKLAPPKAPKPKPQKLEPGPVICNVEPIICPAGKDHRFTVTHPTPYFTALAIGSYVPSDSWASKVYG